MITAKEIQEELKLSAENLVMEAREIASKKDDTHDRLAALGFERLAKRKAYRSEWAKELDDLVDRYSFEYPGLKFVPGNVMSEVCRKYELVCGHVSHYAGEVPEWALKIIEQNRRHIGTEKVYDADLHDEAARKLYEARKDEFGGKLRVLGSRGIFEGGWHSSGTATLRVPPEDCMRERPNLYIAAPVADMELDRGQMVQDGEIVQGALDPIVCLKVEGGYIVLVAWGEEGQDPRVFNALNN